MSSRCKLLVNNVPRTMRYRSLERLFSDIGRIRTFDICGDSVNVEYYESRHADEAIERLHHKRVDGSRLSVESTSRDRDRESADRGSPQDRGTCYNCGKTGHW